MKTIFNSNRIPSAESIWKQGRFRERLLRSFKYLSVAAMAVALTSPVTLPARDTEPPRIAGHQREADTIIIFLEDAQTKVQVSEAYGVLEDGARVEPLAWNEEEQSDTFPFPEETMNIYVPDANGNVMHAVLTPGK